MTNQILKTIQKRDKLNEVYRTGGAGRAGRGRVMRQTGAGNRPVKEGD